MSNVRWLGRDDFPTGVIFEGTIYGNKAIWHYSDIGLANLTPVNGNPEHSETISFNTIEMLGVKIEGYTEIDISKVIWAIKP